jgi:hypothetical protein
LLVAVLLNPRRQFQYVTAHNLPHGLLVGYCFRRSDFPWAAIWEENKVRTGPPWNGISQTRGMEFGSTPSPITRREAFAVSPLFNTPTFSIVPARGKKTANYVSFLAKVPEDFGVVRDVQVAKNEILIQGSGRRSSVRLPASGLTEGGWV